ncbi:MAG: hypothetical protein HQL90_15210, partial [Magnetococcales bacterium]|nr:hypothetical protein [Magnetococcales bacterium]
MATKKPLFMGADGRPTELSAVDSIPLSNVPEMGAASVTVAGTAGAVPAPPIGGQVMFIRGDKQWVVPDHALLGNLQGGTAGQFYHLTSAYNTALTGLSTAEIGTLSGVTSAIQTQLGGKQASITGAASSITTSNLSLSMALVSDGSGKVAASAVTATELGYVSGVTSAIQTQLGGKQATITGAATTITGSNLTVSRAL